MRKLTAKEHREFIRFNIQNAEMILYQSKLINYGRHSHTMNSVGGVLSDSLKELKKLSLNKVTLERLGIVGKLAQELVFTMWMIKNER